MSRRAFGLSMLLLVACGGDGGAPDGGASVDAARSAVQGTWFVHYHSASDETTVPIDLTGITVAAWVPLGDGQFERIEGAGNPDGRFFIADVPEERVYIQVYDVFVATADREIDLGWDAEGRPDYGIGSAGTTLRADVSALSPWEFLDDLMLSVPGLGFSFPLQYLSTAEIPAGATEVADLTCDWEYFPLIEAGDAAALYQYETVPVGSESFSTPTRGVDLAAFSMAAGATTDITAAMAPLDATQSFRLQWNPTAYAGQATTVHPDAFPIWAEISLGLAHGGADPRFLFTYAAPQLVRGSFLDPQVSIDRAFTYADPFPARWARTIYASMTFVVDVAIDAAAPTWLVADMIYASDLAGHGDGPITVRLAPVDGLWINGTSTSGPRTGVGTNPTLTWQPPLLGEPTGYDVQVMRLFVNGSETDYEFGATFFTVEPELTFPPGVLVEGEQYAFRVAAVWAPAGDVATRPRRISLPYAVAEAWTSPVAP